MNQKKQAMTGGFTLVEVLVSVLLLAVGLIVVYRPLLISVDALQYATKRLEANHLIEREIWEVERMINETGDFPKPISHERLIGLSTIYTLTLVLSPFNFTEDLKRANVEVTWSDFGKIKKIRREVYFIRHISQNR